MNAKDHYDNHLGSFYSWMVGDFEEKSREQEIFFKENHIAPTSNKVAFDLGAGHGLQSIALSRLGLSVKSVDFNKQLLDELALRKNTFDIEIIHDDILNYVKMASDQAELIVCMGDTLTHLESLQHVSVLLSEISKHLIQRGKVIFSFRDLTTELRNEQRFIPVKSDEHKILTCFLEYFPDYVLVHDILHEKKEGKWIQKVSAYPKLRLNATAIVNLFQKHNIRLVRSKEINRMIYLIGEKVVNH